MRYSQLVNVSVGLENSPNPVTELVLLQELFGEVLEVPLRERHVGSNSNVLVALKNSISTDKREQVGCLTVANNLNVVPELSSLAIDLDAVDQELFKVCAIKDTVRGWP